MGRVRCRYSFNALSKPSIPLFIPTSSAPQKRKAVAAAKAQGPVVRVVETVLLRVAAVGLAVAVAEGQRAGQAKSEVIGPHLAKQKLALANLEGLVVQDLQVCARVRADHPP